LIAESPVLNDGVWHNAHPVVVNNACPSAIDNAPPGVLGCGVGGALTRMKKENFSIELIIPTGVAASVSEMLLGCGAN
jgi:hypothetical protein